MFTPQAARRPPGSMQPGAPVQSQSDIHAKEKLAAYVYEYLVISGATKTAEVFKEEVLNNVPNGAIKPYFWDLYCAAPERRDGPDGIRSWWFWAAPDQMMNGMHGPG
ncbi:hypothetical protein OSTOST_03227, partial [Ostertagia ostertagi]